MAYTAGNLELVYGGRFHRYHYNTLDTLTTVDVPGYFNNKDDKLNLIKGDIIEVTVWATEVGGAGTIADYGYMLVMSVAADGAVTISVDLSAITVVAAGT